MNTNGSCTFTVISDTDLTSYNDREASIGTSVNYMGIPYYQEQMNEWLRHFAGAMNDIEKTAKDKDGNNAEVLFAVKKTADEGYNKLDDEYNSDGSRKTNTVYKSDGDNYYQLTSSTVQVNPSMLKNVDNFLTYTTWSDGQDTQDIVEKMKTVKTDKTKVNFRGCSAQEFLQTITADIALNAGAASSFEQNYTDINNSISNQRKMVSGVDNDEEALNLVKFREAYNLAAKMMSVMQEIYDRLINSTGV